MEIDDSYFLVEVEGDTGSDAASTLSFSRSPTVLLQFAAGRFTRSAARLYQKEYGVGATEWRMLVMLTRKPESSVSEASETIGIDKGAVSRALAAMEKKGLVEAIVPDGDARRRKWLLTKDGKALHATILDVAMTRQRKLLAGFSEQEVKDFNAYLTRFMHNLDALNEA